MTIAHVKIKEVRKNPFRDFDEYPLIEKKVEALKSSIQETGFWNNILGREKDGAIEIAYGHHRLEAARQALGDDHQIAITLRDMSDVEMFRIMGLENSEDWMNPVQHTEQVIKQGRAFFDSWLEQFPTWDDFVQGCLETPLAEFGPHREIAVKQVTEWLGGAAEAAHNYANIVKYGVGATILHRFTGVSETTILAALLALGPTEREKRMLDKIEAERQAAETEAHRQAEIVEKAKQEQAKATEAIRAAEKERIRQNTIARNVKAGPQHDAAKAKEAEQSKASATAMQQRDAAKTTLKQAQKALAAAEEIATTSTQAETKKREAAEKQAHYDEKANKVWDKWAHVNAFRALCLEPGHQAILAKSKQVEFARYIKKNIRGEITVGRIQDLFRANVRDFLAGVRTAQKKKRTPVEVFESLFKEWVSSLAACRSKTVKLRAHCAKQGHSKLASFIALEMEEELSKTIAEYGASCDYFDLDVECLTYVQPLQEKVVSIC